jgi:hypothetical protein
MRLTTITLRRSVIPQFDHGYRYYSKGLTVNRVIQNEGGYQKKISTIKK